MKPMNPFSTRTGQSQFTATQLEMQMLQAGCLQTATQMEYIRLHQQGLRQDELGIWYSPAEQAFNANLTGSATKNHQ